MRRDEAVTCLKEITSTCTNMSPDSVALVQSKPDDPLSVGYQVHIETVLDQETERQLEDIAKKLHLALKKEKDKVIIYKPKAVVKTA